MAKQNYTNTASIATVSGAAISSGATSVTVANFTGWPSVPFWAEFARGTASAEVVKVTAVAGNVLTITRGQDGTTAAGHNVGDALEHIIPAYAANLAESHPEATTGAHGISGQPVGDIQVQTLVNKTYRGAHTATFSDANPTYTAGFLATADNTNAKDGFVHANTAGDPDRAAFRSTQAGADRFVVFNDGTTQITRSGSATRPTLNVTAGPTTLGGTLAVTGTQTNTGLLTASGGVDVGGNLTVTGTVTLPEQTVGSVPRVNVKTNVAQRALEVRRGSDNALLVHMESTGQLVSTSTIQGATVAATGAATAENGNVTSFSQGGFSSHKGLTPSVGQRDLRQPIVHAIALDGLNTTVPGSQTRLLARTFTVSQSCHLDINITITGQGLTAGAANVGYFFVKFQTVGDVDIDGTGGVYAMSYSTSPSSCAISCTPGSGFSAGTSYKFSVFGVLNQGSYRMDAVQGTLKEVLRVDSF